MAPIFLSRSKELLKLVRFVSDPENFSEVSPELFPDAAVDDEVGRGVDRQEEVVKVQQVKHQDLKREQFSSLGFIFYSTGIRYQRNFLSATLRGSNPGPQHPLAST